jgi:precorrin-6A/cobalt-precorrin-6A reductase
LAVPGKTILILGGTKEAAELAKQRVAEGHDVTTSLAGRTREPLPLDGKVRIGGFGGVEGLAHYLTENRIEQVIDCTHPFARNISAHAVTACALAAVPLDIRTRKPWDQVSGDLWTVVPSLEVAARELKPGSNVLLALGKQHLAPFANRPDCHFFIRMVDPPDAPLSLGPHEIIIGKPSARWQDEADLMTQLKVDTIICRNSGGDGAYAKIVAARELQLPVIILEPVNS